MTDAFCYHDWALADDMLQSAYVERLRCAKCQRYGYTKDDPLRVRVALYTEQGAANQLRDFKRDVKVADRHDLDKCPCASCDQRRERLSSSDKSIKVTRVTEIPKQRQRAFVDTPSGDLVSMIKRSLTSLGVKVFVCVAFLSCGAHRHVAPVTIDTACDRAEECGVDVRSRDACEFCVSCLVKMNGEQLKSVLVDAQSIACPTAVKWWDELLATCASEWVPGSRCGNSRGEEVRR